MVDFSQDYIHDSSLKSNRNKIKHLGKLLESKFNPKQVKVRGLIDKDFGDLIAENIAVDFIWKTDFSSLEGYLIESDIINKFLSIGFHNFPVNVDTVLSELIGITSQFFFIRCARIVLEIEYIKLIEIEDSCTIHKNGRIEFDIDEYVGKICMKNPSIKDAKGQILKTINQLKEKAIGDMRNFVHGHDFTSIFFKYVKCIKNTSSFNKETFEKAFFLSNEFSEWNKFTLFQKILESYK